jgi:hypothetical protein
MGLKEWDTSAPALNPGEKLVILANRSSITLLAWGYTVHAIVTLFDESIGCERSGSFFAA